MDRRNGIVSYLTITFSVSWICWLVVAFLTQFTSIQLLSPVALPLYSLGAAGPLIGACVVNKRSLNNVDFRRYIKNIFNLKQPIFAYVSMIGLAWGVCFSCFSWSDATAGADLYSVVPITGNDLFRWRVGRSRLARLFAPSVTEKIL